jgi:hypothetical protein
LNNLFDIANALQSEPEKVVVGDYIQWQRADLSAVYSPTLYDLTYVARITGGGNTEVQVVCTSVNGIFTATVTSTTSSAFVAGFYHWQAEIKRKSDDERIVVDRGYFQAIADLDVNGADPRSHAEIMVDKIESLLEGKADADVANYSVAGRSLTKMSFAELVEARDYYKAEYNKELKEERIRRGKPTGATVKVRFTN